MKVGFIGLGNMATAMIGGILQKGIVEAKDILGTNRSAAKAEAVREQYGITICQTNSEAAEKSDILVLAVKPQFYAEVIAEIRSRLKNDCLIVSIAPGKSLKWLEEQLGEAAKVVRCMPNTPALVGEGCTGVCCNDRVTQQEQKMVLELLGSFGMAELVSEQMMDAVIGVSGSAPAYVLDRKSVV